MSDTSTYVVPEVTESDVDVSPSSTEEEFEDFQDFIAKRVYGYKDYEDAVAQDKYMIRAFVQNYFQLANGVAGLYKDLEEKGYNDLPRWVRDTLDVLKSNLNGSIDTMLAEDIAKEYVALVQEYNGNTGRGFELDTAQYIELRGNQIVAFIEAASAAMEEDQTIRGTRPDPFNFLFPDGVPRDGQGRYQPNFEFLEANKKLQAELLDRPGKFRPDTQPSPIDRWQCRIGAATFLVPPISVNVSQSFNTQSLTGGAIRQPNSPKTNLGHSDVNLSISLMFPNHESIWGFSGDKADFDIFNWDPQPYRVDSPILGQSRMPGASVPDAEIDYYLSSLRGLVTQFKYSPILPIRNEYINRTYGISAVTLNSMTISTLENFPFVLQVTLDMKKFNFQPYLPMIQDFDQAIHWGRFRQYMGRAAAALDAKVNESFVIEKAEPNPLPASEQFLLDESDTDVTLPAIPVFNKLRDLGDGRSFNFWYPKSTPSRIYAPDTTDFRQPGEDMTVTDDIWEGFLDDIGLDFVKAPDFNFYEYSNAYRRVSSERNLLTDWLEINDIMFTEMNDDNFKKFINQMIADGKRDESINPSNEDLIREQLTAQWYYMAFDGLARSSTEIKKIRDNLEDSANYKVKEWEVPMERLYINWDHCIVQGVSVNLLNNFAPMQIQAQENPTYQHIGGGDSTVSVNMLVLGESNLIRLQRMFTHINGLARLEQGHGVLGFLGIKNVITSLCGIKYVLPLGFESQSVPNQPHVYSVNMSFVDFDIMQQRREELNNSQQQAIVKVFGKRNPFLRLKQMWNTFNGYPDMPLDVHDAEGNLLGYMDPDWYFRSFIPRDQSASVWGIDPEVNELIIKYNKLATQRSDLNEIETRNRQEFEYREEQLAAVREQMDSVTEKLARVFNETGQLAPGYTFEDGAVVKYADLSKPETLGEPESRQYLGVYGESNEIAAFLDFMPGGYFMLGYEDTQSQKDHYVLGMAGFRDDLASKNSENVRALPGTVNLAAYQQEHLEGATSPNHQYETMMQDFDYRNLKGRMLKAYPTYMLWLIDEGGRFAGIKLFDNYYGLNSVIDFAVHLSEDCIEDTLVLTLSNIYEKLTTPFHESIIPEDSPLYETPMGQWLNNAENRARNIDQGMIDTNDPKDLLELNNIRLKPGVRVHLRAGYGSNPNNLQTIFNGVIAEVQQGEIMTVVCQSDAVELTSMVNSSDTKGDTGKMNGGIGGLWMAEPRDLMVRLLSMGSSAFKEWIAWGTKGVIFSESKFGIRHFGNMMYEPLTDTHETAHANVQASVFRSAVSQNEFNDDATGFAGLLGDDISKLGELESITDLASFALDSNLFRMAQFMWMNSFSNRDYEVFKRNIYPGNGTGIAQYMGGDMLDGGLLLSRVIPSADAGVGGANIDARNEFLSTADRITESFLQENVERQAADAAEAESLQILWDNYKEEVGGDDAAILAAIGTPSTTDLDLTQLRDDSSAHGILENLLNNDITDFMGIGGMAFPFIGGTPFGLGSQLLDRLGDKLGVGIPGMGSGIMSPVDIVGFLGNPKMVVSTMSKVLNSPIGKAMGLTPIVEDDDVQGYDEVSFRAQTYMKTVWDMFKICAALLPNYIVAIRPFEDRSTVFYGKPHWLYTSGVIPLSAGIPRGNENRPRLQEPNEQLAALMDAFTKASGPESNLRRIIDEEDLLKDIMEFQGVADPLDAGGEWNGNSEAEAIISDFIERKIMEDDTFSYVDVSDEDKAMLGSFLLSKTDYLAQFTTDDISKILDDWENIVFAGGGDDLEDARDDVAFLNERLQLSVEEIDPEQLDPVTVGKDLIDEWIELDTSSGEDRFEDQAEVAFGDSTSRTLQFAYQDPLTFAYQFGWKFSFVPVWIAPNASFGNDEIGHLARQKYDEGYSIYVDAPGDGRGDPKARDIWRDFRTDQFRGQSELVDIYNNVFEFDVDVAVIADENSGTNITDTGIEEDDSPAGPNFEAMLDMFMRFLWQDPFNRAWVVTVVDKDSSAGNALGAVVEQIGEEITGPIDAIPIIPNFNVDDENGQVWKWDRIFPAWEEFLKNPITFNENGVPQSEAARGYMMRNDTPGKNAGNPFTGMIEDVQRWVDENLGQLLGIIGDTLTGFVSSIRMSLSQMGNALSMSGDMQRQANILNSVFDDSIYYQAGEPGSLMRMVDNPFTNEYGEPVIEIREPFQRVHFVSSFDTILHNGVKENLGGVPTVVTAVSDGKYPVKVHLDKGIPPDKQTEMIVETGLYWDNAFGSGIFGVFHPLLHPFESIRSYSKAALGSSDELSSRRVALYHLKEGLKDIYMGEIIMVGDPDIRPFDLLYIADITERMYGMVEVESVRHNFSPQTGFTTHVTPNAVVTVNDPARWTMLSYMGSKFANYNLKDDVRAAFAVNIDRALSDATLQIDRDDVYRYFGTQMNGSLQYTLGNSALIRDIGALYTGGGVDKLWDQIATADVAIGVGRGFTTLLGAGIGSLFAPGPGTAIGIAAGFGVGELAWNAWDWVKDNLLDQHGCYIQFLNKNGQPMDAGLSHYQGLAVGSNHTVDLFPNILGIKSPTGTIRDPDGHYRITTNDLLGALGWSEVDTLSLYRDTSLYVNQINSQILGLAGRSPTPITDSNVEVFTARVPDDLTTAIIDGDTMHLQVIGGGNMLGIGEMVKVRFAGLDTGELQYKNVAGTNYNDVALNDPNSIAVQAYNYLLQRFSNPADRTVAVRIDRSAPKDRWDRYLGVIFHNTPIGTTIANRLGVLGDMARRLPLIPWDAFMEDGRPYTLNWEMVMTGYGNVYMVDAIWDTEFRQDQLALGGG